jgi:hypothetical protein
MSNRSAFLILLSIALVAWGGLLTFTHFIPPRTFLAFSTFFLILAVAITSTIAPFAYLIAGLLFRRCKYKPSMRSAIRRGLLCSVIVVLNLLLRVLNSWNLLTAILIVLAIFIIEAIISHSSNKVGP